METWYSRPHYARLIEPCDNLCDGCEFEDVCERGMACRVYLNWLDTGLITGLVRKPSEVHYEAAFRG